MIQTPPEPSIDIDAISRVLAGEVNAFETLMRRHEDYVLRILRRHLPADHITETVQDVFIRAYQSLPTFRQESSFRSWLSSIAVRTCCDFWRKRYRNREMPLSSLNEAHEEWLEKVVADESGRNFEEAGRQKEAAQLLDWALAKLSPEDRMVLELVHLEEYPVRDAARMLGWSVANVKVRAFRSRKKLYKLLKPLMKE